LQVLKTLTEKYGNTKILNIHMIKQCIENGVIIIFTLWNNVCVCHWRNSSHSGQGNLARMSFGRQLMVASRLISSTMQQSESAEINEVFRPVLHALNNAAFH